ncbi:MAG: hypothetical protein HYZ34_14410 [Ignavibacteriae bacterium]|nr:hypothetical protein [Ignavibacteriota bacterium]
MINSQYKMNPQLLDELNRLKEEEKHAVEFYRERTDAMQQPLFKLFNEMIEQKQEDESEKIVVEQINEMFL